MNEFIECPNCGYDLNKGDRECKYCGTKNPHYVEKPAPIFHAQSHTETVTTATPAKNDSKISIPIFILLLIFCWPVAIVYLVLKSIK